MTNTTTENLEQIVARVRKLLALAGNNPNEAEAASATAMAARILEQHNLEMSTVVAGGGADAGQRGEEKKMGGHHSWERDLWRAVAELNMCVYFNDKVEVAREKHDARSAARANQSTVTRRVHRIVGRRVNILSTEVMAEYLLAAAGRLAQEYVGDPKLHRSRAAISFREGAAERLSQRVRQLRRDREQEARAAAAQRDQAAAAARAQGGATGTALILADVLQAEADANTDFIYGEGYSARQRAANAAWDVRAAAQRVQVAAARAEEERLLAAWAAANPAAAAKKAAKEARAAEREQAKRQEQSDRYWQRQANRVEQGDPAARSAGRVAGEGISLAQQVGAAPKARQLH